MGIERKKLSVTEKGRLNTAIHECGHALTCYFNKHALKLYKATIVARGAALGTVSIKFQINMLFIDIHGARRIRRNFKLQSQNSCLDRCCNGWTCC